MTAREILDKVATGETITANGVEFSVIRKPLLEEKRGEWYGAILQAVYEGSRIHTGMSKYPTRPEKYEGFIAQFLS